MTLPQLTDRPVNIFVAGDLVIDHTNFVVAKVGRHHAIDDEKVYDVRRRINTAGGAANCARILGALSRGATYLWGVTGRSLWGAFTDVLEHSEVADVNVPKIRMIGYHDDTLRMNTITRVIRVDAPRHVHLARFDDVGGVGPGQLASQSLLHQLRKVNDEMHLAAIIISDLDMSALDESLLKEISAFASAEQIPLFVDPKRNFQKYEHVQGTAVLPNLYEWCELIGEADYEEKWRNEIRTTEGLERFAHRSLQRFASFKYHIVKCDQDGSVIIGPARDNPHRFSVVRLPPHQADSSRPLINQLGSGDVLTAVTAMEFTAADMTSHPTDRMIRAVQVGSWAVAAFRQMPWGQIPSRDDVLQVATPIPAALDSIDVSAGIRYLPSGDHIDLTLARTPIPPLLSVDKRYTGALNDLLAKLREQWQAHPLRSMIVTARGGSGKSEICAALPSLLKPAGVSVLVASDAILKSRNSDDLLKKIDQERTASGFLAFVVDEAFERASKFLQHKKGVLLLDAMHSRGIRLVMIDADFHSARPDLSESQFLTRCDVIELPPLIDRPLDIPYIFLAGCAQIAKDRSVSHFFCERRTLANVVDVTLRSSKPQDQSPRTVFNSGRDAFEAAAKGSSPEITVRTEHLAERFVISGARHSNDIVMVRYD